MGEGVRAQHVLTGGWELKQRGTGLPVVTAPSSLREQQEQEKPDTLFRSGEVVVGKEAGHGVSCGHCPIQPAEADQELWP